MSSLKIPVSNVLSHYFFQIIVKLIKDKTILPVVYLFLFIYYFLQSSPYTPPSPHSYSSISQPPPPSHLLKDVPTS